MSVSIFCCSISRTRRIFVRTTFILLTLLYWEQLHASDTLVETADFCSIYPITVSQHTLAGAQVGQVYTEIPNGTGQGNYSWLTWRGDNDAKNIETSLIPPGNSDLYINPNNPDDTKLEIGDWTQGAPGVKNSKGIRGKMDALLGKDIIIPVWNDMIEQGSNRDYLVADFAVITLDGYELSGKGYISFTFKNFTTCYNKPPVIVSTPPMLTPEKSVYQYQVEVEDPNTNDIHTFTFDKSPIGMTVTENGGLVEWLPTDDYVQSTPNFNQQCYVVPNGSAKVYEEGDIINSATYIAPLFQRVKDAIESGGDYTARESVTWDKRHKCLGCHVQTQSLLGLQTSKEKADIDEEAAEYLLNRILTSQHDNGTVYDKHASFFKTQTAFALWALTFVPDVERTFDARKAALDYFWSVRQTSGEHVYWTNDHASGWIRFHEAITAVVAQAAARYITEAQARKNITSAQQQTIDNYLGIFPNISEYLLDNAYDNHNENMIHAFRMIGLGEIKQHTTDEVISLRIGDVLSDNNTLLRGRQREDGGWGRYSNSNASDPLTSAWVGLALDQLSPPLADTVVTNNIEFLLDTQSANGTWVTNSHLFSTHLATTSLVMAYLPVALEHLGNPDTTVRHIIYNEIDEISVNLSATVMNRGLSDITVPILVKFYNGASANGNLLGTHVIDGGLASDTEVQVSISTAKANITEDVSVVLDATPETPECNISNNEAKAALITVRATDLGGLYDTQTWLLNVDDVNETPVITSEPELTLEGGQVFDYRVTTEDNDAGDAHFFSIQSGPDGLYIDPRTGQFSSNPNLLAPGTYEVAVLVEDLRGLTTTQIFTLTVNKNLPPEITSPAEQRFTEGQQYHYWVAAQDPNPDDVLEFGFEYKPEDMMIDSLSGQITWLASHAWVDPLTNHHSLCEAQPAALDASLEPVEKWRLDTNILPLPSYRQVMHTPIVAPLLDTNGNGYADKGDEKAIIFHSFAGTNYTRDGILRAVSAKDGSHLWSVTNNAYRTHPAGSIAVADIDDDGFVEIVAPKSGGGIIVFEHTGEFKWQADVLHNMYWGGASISDLDNDGIPEIIVGRTVFNNAGELLWEGSGAIGFSLSFAADVNLDGYHEVIAGGAVYSHDGQIIFDNGEGFSGVGNFDEDDFPEIVNIRSGSVYLYEHTGSQKWTASIPGGGKGGAPTIADMTGDGIPEIGVAGASQYAVFDYQGSLLWSSATKDNSSNVTGSSVFDFNGDKRAEVVYADEFNLRIYDGPTGDVLYQIPNTSGTTYELPVIADIDDDGHAEIVIISNSTIWGVWGNYAGIRVFEGRDDNWAPTRGIWNQHAYAINNINDDGSVPTNPEPSWLTHNTFRLNTFLDRPVLAQADVIVSEIQFDQASSQVTALVSNRGLAPVDGQISVNFYHEHFWSGDTALGTVEVIGLAAGESQQVTLAVDAAALIEAVRAEVSVTGQEECITDNNTARAAVVDLRVFDEAGLWDEQKFLVSGVNVNEAPTISSDNVSIASVGVSYAFQVKVSDPDAGDAIRYALTNAPAELTIDEITGLIRSENLAEGIYTYTITVTDLGGLTDSQVHVLTVSPPGNLPPEFTSTPLLQVYAGERYQYPLAATDPDGDQIVFVLSQGPDTMFIDSATGLLEWPTSTINVGSYNVKITAIDALGASTSQSFVLEVMDPFLGNMAPVITSVPEGVIYAGQNFVYQVVATDADNDPLTYRLENAAAGMSISASGEFNWLPSQEQVGQSFKVDIIVEDGRGGFATQSLTLPVNESANNPPAITSTPEVQALVDQPYSYNIQTQDPDGDVVNITLDEAPNGMSLSGNTIHWTPSGVQAGAVYTVSIRATDTRGAMSTQTFGVAVNQTAAHNTIPEILSLPTSPAIAGELYGYQVVAVDAENDPLTYSASSDMPFGMSLDQNGLLSWTPTTEQVGSYAIAVTVSDGLGFTTQSFTLAVVLPSPNSIPSITSLPKTEASQQNAYAYQVLASDADNDPLTYGLLTSPAGMSIDTETGLMTWSPNASQIGSHDVQVYAQDNKGGQALQSYSLVVFEQALPLEVDILLSTTNVAQGDSLTITVLTTGGLGEITASLTVDGQPVALDAFGQATMVAPATMGAHSIEVTVTDDNGSITETSHYYVMDASDTSAPVVNLHSPALDSIHSAPVDVIGSVQDDNLANYTLYLSPARAEQWTAVASGAVNIDHATVGTFDPTMLMNGQYDLLLYATDVNGQAGSDKLTLTVAGDLKVGNFRIAFEDMNIPVGNLPISITRSYDSRQRLENLDFGKGWSVAYQDVRLQESRPAGYQWEVYTKPAGPLGLLDDYCVRPLGDNIVTVVLPDGEVERFKAQAYPECELMSIPRQVSIIFAPLDDTFSKLVPVGGSNIYQVLYGHLLADIADAESIVEFDQYQLTTEEGYVYDIDQHFGVTKITEPQGETLTFGNNGITHSLGLSVDFVRDSQGRITTITAPDGTQTHYSYDANGDLATYTDANTNVTTFKYHAQLPHYLEEILDPLGNRAIRNEYDDSGRLIAQIDADGNRIEFIHDVDGRVEIVKDANNNTLIYVYDDRGNVLHETNALGEVTQRTYDQYGNELTRTNHLGETMSWSYDARGRQITETDPLGNTTATSYDNYNAILTVTEPDGTISLSNVYKRQNQYGKPINGPLLSMTDALGNTSNLNYNIQGLLSSLSDAVGNVTSFSYDSLGNKTSETAPNGKVTTYTYDANGNVLSETTTRTDENGVAQTLTTNYTYDANGNLLTTVDPLGNLSASEYNGNNQVIAEIDANGNRTEYDYDARSNKVLTRYADGSTESTIYDANGNVTSQTDRAGRITTMTYDAANRLIQTTYPDGSFTQTEYDAAGRVSANIDANGNRTTYGYDAAGRRTTVTDAQGNVTTTEYDTKGQHSATVDANGHRVTYQYDAAGKQTGMTLPDGSTTQTGYDAIGRRTSATDQAGITTQFENDPVGSLTAVIDALSQRTEYGYDEQSNKVTQTDANSRTTAWAYDHLGRTIRRTLPLGQIEQMTYDTVGNLATRTDFNGNQTTYTYNNLNQLIQVDYADGSQETYSYDVMGNRTQAHQIDSLGNTRTTNWTYDLRYRLDTETQADGSTLAYGYDDHGNRTSVTLTPAGGGQAVVTTYGYNTLNQLETVTDANGTTTYGYDAVGNRTSVSYPNGTSQTYAYDSQNRLTSLSHYNSVGTLVQRYDYTLDPTGRRTAINELSGRVSSITHDSLYRLTDELITDPAMGTGGTHQFSYQYDATGNRISRTVNGVVTTYSYDANDRLQSLNDSNGGSVSYTHDANGNTLTQDDNGAVTTYSYDQKSQLIESSQGTTTTTYQYSANGIRNSKTETDSGAGTTTQTAYAVDENRDYAQVLQETNDTDTTTYTYGDDLISQDRSTINQTSYFNYDGLGSTRSLTDATGNVTDTYDYEAFGELLNQTGTTENAYRFTGEQYDSTLGQYYLRARYYDQGVGRFTQMDTWMGRNQDPITLHKYLYANADPANMIDPSGYFSIGSMMASVNVRGTLSSLATPAYTGFVSRSVGASIMTTGRVAGKLVLPLIKRCIKKKNKCGLRLNLLIIGNNHPNMLSHIREAQMSRPRTIALTYMPNKKYKSGWYKGKGGCALSKPSASYQCDEYPMQRTREGGPENWPGRVSLRWVPGSENMSVGGYFGVLAKAMKKSKKYRFYVITTHSLPTMALPLAKK